VMDFIHVLEYLWKAAWCLFKKDDPEVEDWIEKRATEVLRGNASQVAKGLGVSATKRKLKQREGIDKCIGYLLKNKSRLEYGKALEQGFPIASGVIEGACRHLINDRLDITGARWSLEGAEAILKLRSLRSSGDLEKYWEYHKKQSKQRLYGC
ncbi:ISKra4 family transposase, partial [Parashewanella curva]